MAKDLNLNLDEVFRKVLRYSVHDKTNISRYQVGIPWMDEVLVYFQGKRCDLKKLAPGDFVWHGHIFRVEKDLPSEPIRWDDGKITDEYGFYFYRPGRQIFFKEVLYSGQAEPGKRAGDSVAEKPNTEPQQL